jgi:hypothetical protein
MAERLPRWVTSDRLTLLALGSMPVASHPWMRPFGRQMLLLDVAGLLAAAGFVVVFIPSAIRTTRALHHAEPLPSS